MSTFTMMVAEIIARNHSSTETSLDFVASFASPFPGITMSIPSHTMIPTAK